MKALTQIPKEKLQKVILVLIGTLVAIAAVYIFYVGKELDQKEKSLNKIAKLEKDIQAVQTKAKEDLLLEKNRTQIMAFVETQKGAMVTGEDPYSWCNRQITLFSEKFPNVRILGVRPGARSKHLRKERYDVFEVQMEVEGAYDQLGRFLCGFENQFSTAEIRKLEVQAAGATGTDRRLGFTVAFLMLPASSSGKASPAKRNKSEAP